MKLLAVVLVVLACVCASQCKPFVVEWQPLKVPQDQIWTNCTKASDQGVIDSVTYSPNNPKKGDDLTIQGTFMLKENVTGGTIKVEAKLDGIKLYSGTLDLCDTIQMAGLSCPLTAGQHMLKVSTKIPEIAPRGTYEGDGTVEDQNGKEIFCASAKYKLE